MRKRRRNGLGIDIMDRRIGSKSRSGARESSKSNVHIDTMPTIYAQDQARSENEPVARGPRRAGIPGRHLPTITLPPHLIRSFAQVEALGRQLPHATHTAFGGRGGDIRHPEEGEGGRYRACAYYNVRNTVKRSPSSSASGEKGRERRGIPARIPPPPHEYRRSDTESIRPKVGPTCVFRLCRFDACSNGRSDERSTRKRPCRRGCRREFRRPFSGRRPNTRRTVGRHSLGAGRNPTARRKVPESLYCRA